MVYFFCIIIFYLLALQGVCSFALFHHIYPYSNAARYSTQAIPKYTPSRANKDTFINVLQSFKDNDDSTMWGNRRLRYPTNTSDTSNGASRVSWNNYPGGKNIWDSIENILSGNVICSNRNSTDSAKPNAMDLETLNINGRWIEDSGNYLLPPPENKEVVAVIHFLGGAFVGAAPHLTYRYFLEYLADKGYLIVATPYRLGFDYISICDEVLTKFDAVGVKLANMYGPLPVIGLGHSCGALLQTLITSLFPDTPRAVNVLLSFNNRPVSGAIPLFEELVVPISEDIMSESDLSTSAREIVRINRNLFNQALNNFARSKLAPRFIQNDIVPIIEQSLEIVDQFPPLLQMIARGAKDFVPDIKDAKEITRKMYRARSTLLIKFDNDDLDDTPGLEKVLREANAMISKSAGSSDSNSFLVKQMDLEVKVLKGTHITPLTQDFILDVPPSVQQKIRESIGFGAEIFAGEAAAFNPIRTQIRTELLKTIDEVASIVVEFLDRQIKL